MTGRQGMKLCRKVRVGNEKGFFIGEAWGRKGTGVGNYADRRPCVRFAHFQRGIKAARRK